MVVLGGDAVSDDRGTPVQVTYGQIITLRHSPSGVHAHSQPQLLFSSLLRETAYNFRRAGFHFSGHYAIPGLRKALREGRYPDLILGAVTRFIEDYC